MKKTFRDLETESMAKFQPETPLSSLAGWYATVRDTPLDMLEVGGLCRAIRQKLCLPEVLPLAVEFLRSDVLGGYKYDGELIVCLSGLNGEVWRGNKKVAHDVLSMIERFPFFKECPDVEPDVSKLISDIKVALLQGV